MLQVKVDVSYYSYSRSININQTLTYFSISPIFLVKLVGQIKYKKQMKRFAQKRSVFWLKV